MESVIAAHIDERRVAARDDECHEGWLERRVREEVREDMAFEMVDTDERLVERKGQGLGRRDADEQCADESRSVRHGDLVDVRERHTGLADGLIDDGHDVDDVLARSDLRHDTAKLLVNGNLRRDDVRQDRAAAAQHGSRRLITARLNAQSQDFLFQNNLSSSLHSARTAITISYST